MRSLLRSLPRLLVLAFAGALPAACAAPEMPPNPFAGAWVTAERNQIAFRDSTVVQQPINGSPTAVGQETCAGKFRFGYGRKTREALMALMPRQPDLRRKLADLLARPDYPVAELGCDQGDTTYVLLDDRDLVAIYRDGDIAGIERLSRPEARSEARSPAWSPAWSPGRSPGRS